MIFLTLLFRNTSNNFGLLSKLYSFTFLILIINSPTLTLFSYCDGGVNEEMFIPAITGFLSYQ